MTTRTHVIKVSLEKETLNYHGREAIFVQRGDAIRWEVDGGIPFALQMSWDSPFQGKKLGVPAGRMDSVTVPENARPGIFKYSIALWNGENVVIDDPIIIIRPPE